MLTLADATLALQKTIICDNALPYLKLFVPELQEWTTGTTPALFADEPAFSKSTCYPAGAIRSSNNVSHTLYTLKTLLRFHKHELSVSALIDVR